MGSRGWGQWRHASVRAQVSPRLRAGKPALLSGTALLAASVLLSEEGRLPGLLCAFAPSVHSSLSLPPVRPSPDRLSLSCSSRLLPSACPRPLSSGWPHAPVCFTRGRSLVHPFHHLMQPSAPPAWVTTGSPSCHHSLPCCVLLGLVPEADCVALAGSSPPTADLPERSHVGQDPRHPGTRAAFRPFSSGRTNAAPGLCAEL